MAQNESYQIFNDNNKSGILILCDHATNVIPQSVSKNSLGLSQEELASHIAYDIGALETSKKIARNLDSTLISSRFSRLVVDPNRSQQDPTLIMKLYDESLITGNLNLDKAQIQKRMCDFYYPYHKRIKKFITEKKKSNSCLLIISIHSFTPKLKKKSIRPWHIGILWDKDRRLSKLMIKNLECLETICVGKNQPYSGALEGDTMHKHGTLNNIPHALIEIRNDLIATESGQNKWSKILAQIISKTKKQLLSNQEERHEIY